MNSFVLSERLYSNALPILMCYRDGSEDGLAFAFRFTDATISIPNQGSWYSFFCNAVVSALLQSWIVWN
jgi:hypothetical protein